MARALLSARGSLLSALPKPNFSSVYYASLNKLYDPVTCPSGIVNLAVAENRLAAPLLEQRLREAGLGLSAESLAYNPYPGNERVRKAVANVISRHIARCNVEVANLILTNGAGSALWLLAAVLANPGQGVLVPTPYYYAYDRDFCALTDCSIVPVDGCSEEDPLSSDALSAALQRAAADGIACRLLVITSPSNPTGEVVSAERLRGAIAWAEQHGVDVIVNELYACSTTPGSFDSVLSLYTDGAGGSHTRIGCKLPEHVHFVWGLSKDFGANGLRVGCIYSNSKVLIETSTKFLYFFQVGGTIQAQLAQCLEDEAWVDSFLEESRQRINAAVQSTVTVLQDAGVPYVQPKGALFVWADLRRWATAVDGETALFEHLTSLPDGGVLLCPGSTFHAPDGWFRICVSTVPESHLKVGLERLVDGMASLC